MTTYQTPHSAWTRAQARSTFPTVEGIIIDIMLAPPQRTDNSGVEA